MALNAQQLNADTTFLLTFTPPFAPDKTATRFPGDYNILIDPWLSGPSSVLHPSFQLSRHVAEPAISTLKELEGYVDLIIISQDKPDHCHRQTLCSLTRDTKISILATPAAAKKIKSWQHFETSQIQVMKQYNPSMGNSVVTIPLAGYGSSSSGPGRITIANIPAKRDMTGLHNAIGITYQPPNSIFTLNTQDGRHDSGATVQLTAKGFSRPSTPARSRTGSSSASVRPLDWTSANSKDKPGKVPDASHSRVDSGNVTTTENMEKTISIIYSPHGLPPQSLKSYLNKHLAPLAAFPVLALFHSMTVESNPWIMGGTVSLGAPGGIQLAKALGGVQYWISAHDEEKQNLGLATKWCKSRLYGVDEVCGMLADALMGETVVMRLGVGETIRLPVKSKGKSKLSGGKTVSMPNLRRPVEATQASGS
jgi:hypothetical protein